jgi:hypothetical protein
MTVILDLVYYDYWKNDLGELVIKAIADIEDAGLPDGEGGYHVGRMETTYTMIDYDGPDQLSDSDVIKILEENSVDWTEFYDD